MPYANANRVTNERGSALVELAVVLPVLLAILFSTVDLARGLYVSSSLTNAARAGAQYCSMSPANSMNTSGTQAVMAAASPYVSGGYTSNSSTAACYCASDGGTFTSTTCGSTCSSGHMVVTCTVTASKLFNRVTPFPGIPDSIAITRSATMRVTD